MVGINSEKPRSLSKSHFVPEIPLDTSNIDSPGTIEISKRILQKVILKNNYAENQISNLNLTQQDCLTLILPSKNELLSNSNSPNVQKLLLKCEEKMKYVVKTLSNQPELEGHELVFPLSDIVDQCVTLSLIDLKLARRD